MWITYNEDLHEWGWWSESGRWTGGPEYSPHANEVL